LISQELVNRILTSLVLLPVLFYFSFNSGIYLIIFLSLIYFLSFYEIIKNTKNLLFIFLSNLILILAFFSFYYLRGNSNSSLIILYWVLASTFLSDIGGYVVGRIIKGKKLTKISPNKTYSGAVGSIIFSFFALPFLNILQNYFFGQLLVNLLQFNYILLTILISIICQLGDLYISYWKRKIKIKDISNILPGHGGILDRIDGLIFVLIFSFILNIVGAI
tara:strand:+ start:1270 stop:1929 length:660 start_codon:yes stop_codon:yes gene_type:complete